jgi:hypothetical protein
VPKDGSMHASCGMGLKFKTLLFFRLFVYASVRYVPWAGSGNYLLREGLICLFRSERPAGEPRE